MPANDPWSLGTVDGVDRAFVLFGPGEFLFTDEDFLEVDSVCSQSGLVVTVSGAMLTQDLELRPFSLPHTPNSNRTIATSRFPMGAGWLQHVRVVVSTGTPTRGQCFVWVRVCRGFTSNALVLANLVSGYVTGNTDLGFPGGAVASPLDGLGALRSITGTTPSAGADCSEVVPTGARWKLVTFEADLVTAVAVANRVPTFTIDDGTNILFREPVNGNETASATWRNILAAVGAPNNALVGNVALVGAPVDLWLGAGFRIRTSTAAIQAADQYSAPQYEVMEWLEGN